MELLLGGELIEVATSPWRVYFGPPRPILGAVTGQNSGLVVPGVPPPKSPLELQKQAWFLCKAPSALQEVAAPFRGLLPVSLQDSPGGEGQLPPSQNPGRGSPSPFQLGGQWMGLRVGREIWWPTGLGDEALAPRGSCMSLLFVHHGLSHKASFTQQIL